MKYPIIWLVLLRPLQPLLAGLLFALFTAKSAHLTHNRLPQIVHLLYGQWEMKLTNGLCLPLFTLIYLSVESSLSYSFLHNLQNQFIQFVYICYVFFSPLSLLLLLPPTIFVNNIHGKIIKPNKAKQKKKKDIFQTQN